MEKVFYLAIAANEFVVPSFELSTISIRAVLVVAAKFQNALSDSVISASSIKSGSSLNLLFEWIFLLSAL